MPLDINGCDSAFKTFVKFAQHRSKAGLEGDIANATVSKAAVQLGQKLGV